MRVLKLGLLIGLIFLLVSCKPSDKYIGDWYALSDTEEQVLLKFTNEELIIEKDDEEESLSISQTATGFINNVRYFGVNIDDVKHYVVFENKKDESNAILIKQTNHASDFEDVVGDIIYKMNRDDYPEK